MKKRFFIQTGLTTMLFFLFLNLFGNPLFPNLSRNPNVGDLAHNWVTLPNGVIPDWGTYTRFEQTGNLSFEWVIYHCPNDYVFNCNTASCVPPASACKCYGYIH